MQRIIDALQPDIELAMQVVRDVDDNKELLKDLRARLVGRDKGLADLEVEPCASS